MERWEERGRGEEWGGKGKEEMYRYMSCYLVHCPASTLLLRLNS